MDVPLFNYVSPMEVFGRESKQDSASPEKESEEATAKDEKEITPFAAECVIPFLGGDNDATGGTDAISTPPDVNALQEIFRETLKTPIKTSFGKT